MPHHQTPVATPHRTATAAMALAFAIGSFGFVVGPMPGYIDLVGPTADGATFFIASIFFTIGGALQSRLAWVDRDVPPSGRANLWAALIQSAGTLFFNVTTYRALSTAISNPDYNRLVWRPDALGSVCFLVSGFITWRAIGNKGWQPAVNMLGCVFFGISAVAGYVVPSTGTELQLAAANLNTALGAICFLVCAVATFLGVVRARSTTPMV